MRTRRPRQQSIATLAGALALLLLSVTGCGSDDRQADGSSTASTEAAASDSAPADSGRTDPSRTTVGAAGIGISDLAASSRFYQDALGMKELRSFEIPGYMDEIVLGFDDMTRGASVVLMHHTDGRRVSYQDNPVKLVFYVPDPTESAKKIKAAGGTIVLEPAPQAALGDAVVGLAKDLDGYVIELLEAGTGTSG